MTVIIPAYNRISYIEQTVESVLNQSYKNLELIVIDDGSNDGTYEFLKTYGDRITLLTHENRQNKGQSASINIGINASKGEFIAILDSDDYWGLNKLEVQTNFLKLNSDIGLVYSNGHGVDENGNVFYDIYSLGHTETNDPNRVLLDCYILLPQNSLVRKTIYDEVGFFEDGYRSAQDHDMLIRIAEITKLAYLPDFLFFYRRHSQSISVQGTEIRWRTGFKILENARKRYPYKKETIRKRRAVLNFRLGQSLIEKNKYISALVCFLKAGLLDPLRSVQVIFGKEKVN